MKKKWILVSAVGIALVGAGVVLASRSGKEKPAAAADSLPFRLGTVTAEDLQVSVREVGVVDPVTKVDVKSVVSGRVVRLNVRDGAVVKAGRRPRRGRARRHAGPVALRGLGTLTQADLA